MPLYSTISVIYVIEDAVFFDKRIRYLKACAVENVSKFHFFTGIITPVVFRLLDVNEIQLMKLLSNSLLSCYQLSTTDCYQSSTTDFRILRQNVLIR